MKPLLTIAALAAAPWFAHAAPPEPSTWGAPASGVAAPASAAQRPAAPAPATRASSPFAAARATSNATGDYFHDFAELIVRVRSVKWIEEICSEAFPATAELNEHAYDDWIMDHGRFVDEVESQFAVIDRYWQDASPGLKKDGISTEALRRRVEAQRAGLREDFHSTSAAAFQRRCEAYPEILLSPQLDLEKSQVEYVRSMRAGPR
jgi:hypothetical protein